MMFKDFLLKLRSFLTNKETGDMGDIVTELNVGDDASGKVVVLRIGKNRVNTKENNLFLRGPTLIKHLLLRKLREERWWELKNLWPAAVMSMGTGMVVGYIWGSYLG
ncbi:hypothetical protein [Desulfolucanica intricata]|uniref:hypothetical protein n=1 Tax=Desulfolucanica intricata TaxID=1285191 RepID=UPI00083470D7|nr:hypothetical protein [Desulfolucanica intricata]